MKNSVGIVCLFLSSMAFSQELFVIDRSEDNQNLFDESRSTSFVRLIALNLMNFKTHEIDGISENDRKKLSSEQLAQLSVIVGEMGTKPLFDEDPNSPTFGDPLIVMSADGFETFVYDPPDTTYTDFSDVSRIILECRDGKEPVQERIEKVTFCKRYSEEYIPVFQVLGNSLLSLQNVCYFEELPDPMDFVLVSPDAYWEQLRDTLIGGGEAKDLGVAFFPQNFKFMMNMPFGYTQRVQENGGVEFEFTTWHYPFSFRYADIEDAPNIDELLEKEFDSAKYHFFESTVPMMDNDPNSPYFGEPIIETTSDGMQSFVYPAPELVIEWLDFQPYFYVYGEVNSPTSGGFHLRKIICTKRDETGENIVFVHTLNDAWRESLQDFLFSSIDWKSVLNSIEDSLLKGKRYSISEIKSRESLQMSDSFWEAFN